MEEAERGYLAGIIDGEGCITISRQAGGSGGRVNTSHRLYLKITMGHWETLAKCQRIAGGVGSMHLQRGGQWNDAWSWVVATQQAGAIIREVRDLLVTKAEEADVALEFLALPSGLTGGKGGNKTLPPELVAARQDCFERLRDLKPSARFRAAKRTET